MSGENMEDVELLEFYLEEFPKGISLDEILRLSRSCVLEPKLEKSLKRVMRKHKEALADYVIDLCSAERRSCRPGLVFSYSVFLELIKNFEKSYGLEEEVEISKRKQRKVEKNFKDPPKELPDLEFVPKGLTAERDGRFADDYRQKIKRELVPEMKSLGVGEKQLGYVIERTEILLCALPLLQY